MATQKGKKISAAKPVSEDEASSMKRPVGRPSGKKVSETKGEELRQSMVRTKKSVLEVPMDEASVTGQEDGVDENGRRLSPETISKLIEVHRMIDRLFQYYYTPFGITAVQIPVLMTLLKYGTLKVSDLARLLNIGSSNITPLCKRLEKADLVVRQRDNVDQRVVYVQLTKEAKELMESISNGISSLHEIGGEFAISSHNVETICTGVDTLFDYVKGVLINVTGNELV